LIATDLFYVFHVKLGLEGEFEIIVNGETSPAVILSVENIMG